VKDFATHNASYVQVLQELATAGIDVMLTTSLGMNADTPDDVAAFQNVVKNLATGVPSIKLGITYDIEEAHITSGTKFPDAWKQVWASIKAFTGDMSSNRGANWAGWDIALPGACVEECGAAPWLYQSARALDSMYYFNGLRDFYKAALANIAKLMSKCSAGSCKVRIGFEVTDEASACLEYIACKQSFIWGGGLASGQSLQDWINKVMLPAAAEAGIRAEDLASPPFFIEDLSGYIPFVQNVKDGVFPCTTCSKDSGVDSLCP